MLLFQYVGPMEIRDRVRGDPRGLPVSSRFDLAAWARSPEAQSEDGWATYVISEAGELVVASRRTEHVACAGGGAVRCAGELKATLDGDVLEVSNNSTGYCPREDSWPAVEAAFERANIDHPGDFTFTAVFRLCTSCGQRNLVKDDWLSCAVCGADLAQDWNFQSREG